MASLSGSQPLISHWVRRPLGNRPSLVVNRNGINIKKKNGIIYNVNKAVVSKIAQKQNVDISASCNVVNVSPKKVVGNKSRQGIDVSVTDNKLTTSYSSQILNQVTDIDAQDAGFPLLESKYVQEIYQHLWHLETQHRVPEMFLQGHKVSPWMRSTVIDWLIQLQVGLTLLPETLYLTIAILDRYLSIASTTSCDQLQLVAVTAMFIACKYEETQAPEVGAFAYITDNSFTKMDIIKMELCILKALNGYVSFPLPIHFLRRNSKVGDVGQATHTLSKYLLELCLPEYTFSHVSASLQAAASLCFNNMKLMGL